MRRLLPINIRTCDFVSHREGERLEVSDGLNVSFGLEVGDGVNVGDLKQ